MSPTIALILAIFMLAGNAYFVGVEFGLISARRSSIELKAAGGSRSAKITLYAMENIAIMLAGVQLGVTLCSLILGAVGEPLFAHLLEVPFAAIGIPEAAVHSTAFIIALTFMTYMHVVIGEMVPKNLALANPDRTATILTPSLVILVRLTRPVVVSLNAISNIFLSVLGIPPQNEIPSTFTRDEVAGFVEESKREGLITKDEGYLLSNAIDFHEKTIKRLTLPTNSMVVINYKNTPAEVENLSSETGYSRFPIVDDNGIPTHYIHLKDIIDIAKDKHNEPIPAHVKRPLVAISNRSTMRTALAIMQKSESHLACVTNKKRQVEGIITLEDLLEEFVGEIRDDSRAKKIEA